MLNPIEFGKLSFYFHFSQGIFYFSFDLFVHPLVIQYPICDFSCFLHVIKKSFTLLWSERMLDMIWILHLLRLALWLNIRSVPYPLIWKIQVTLFFHTPPTCSPYISTPHHSLPFIYSSEFNSTSPSSKSSSYFF